MKKIILGLCHIESLFPFPETPNPAWCGLGGTRGENVGLGKGWSFRKRREGLSPQAAHALVGQLHKL